MRKPLNSWSTCVFHNYAKSYNRLFGYHGNLEAAGSSATEDKCRVKRKRRGPWIEEDWRKHFCCRFGCLAVMKKYNLSLPDIPCNRNELAQAITGKFHDAFV